MTERDIDWNNNNLQCALGIMLDKGILYDEGLVQAGKEKLYTKNNLVGYVLYLHVRGGLFDDKEKTLVQLEKYFKAMSKSKLRELVNARLRKFVRTNVFLKGARAKDGVEVSVSKKQPMRKVV
jgi:hypothetical protein